MADSDIKKNIMTMTTYEIVLTIIANVLLCILATYPYILYRLIRRNIELRAKIKMIKRQELEENRQQLAEEFAYYRIERLKWEAA